MNGTTVHGLATMTCVEQPDPSTGFSSWLDTYEFQAPGFYEKLGFQPFGTLEDLPPGHRRIFMRKRWDF